MKRSRAFVALLAVSVFFSLSCKELFSPLKNRVDPDADNYQGYPTVADPDDIAVVYPASGGAFVGTEITVTPVVGATAYAVRIAASAAALGTANLYEKSNFTTNVLDISAAPLYNANAYCLQVKAGSGAAWGEWCGPVEFTASCSTPAAAPTFSPAGGKYSATQSVTISCAASGATIYYTTDGSDPATSGTRASGASPVGPIAATVIPKTTIRAIAAAPYCVPSAEAGAAYSLLFDMVSVAGGTYSMGGSTGWFYDGQPIHTVTVSSFMIGTYEVTQAQYAAVAGINPSSFTGDARPVDTVTWYDALEFCNKLSESEGLQNVYTITGRTPASGYPITGAAVAVDWTKNGYRLPTEAEWEWAARGGQSSLGYLYAGSNTPGDVAWYLANLSDASHPVGTKAANELELYDMSGNVWEFCWDWYYSTYPSGPETDPTGPASGTQRVIRGGCWSTDIYDIAVSTRGMCVPDSGGNLVGFRAARSGQ